MQTTDEGEYIPSKELDRTFRIPKKRVNNDEAPVAPQSQVLESSYYNSTPEPEPLVGPFRIDATRNLIVQNLQKREFEKPKTYANHLLRDTIPDCYDESLPRDLTSLFQPLYCKLCLAQLSSNVVAKLHYKSKNHEKKIRKFLIEYSEKTGEPLHKRAKMTIKAKEGEGDDSNPLYFYCDVCDLPLTGKLHAESHYMGRNHRKATLGVKNPAGKGHYDSEGKWIREGSSHKRPVSDPNDDSFGRDFRPEEPPVAAGFRCELCNITTTCQEQLESHYNGQKHKKKLKQQNSETVTSPNDNILSSVLTADGDKGDCSVYRTPSGHYYCQICNCSTNSEVQFKQHLQSKNHLKKASQKRA